MNYYKFHIGDYQSHTAHLDPLEDIAYRRMMDLYYLHERELPLDVAKICKAIRMRSHSDCIEYVLEEFFTETEKGYKHKRICEEIAKAGDKKQKARESALARWGKEKDANALQTECAGNAPITHNPLPTTHNPLSFAQFWNVYPKKKGKSDAEKKWPKLKPEEQQQAFSDCQERYRYSDSQFIPYGSTYLNKKFWEDELTQPDQSGRFGDGAI